LQRQENEKEHNTVRERTIFLSFQATGIQLSKRKHGQISLIPKNMSHSLWQIIHLQGGILDFPE